MSSREIRLGRRVVGAIALGILLFMGCPSPASAQTELERAGARDAASQGLEAYNGKDYAQALDLFSRAESVVHAPTHLLYMARSAAATGQLVRARELYLKLKRESLPAQAPAAFIEAQQAASGELAVLEPRIAKLRIVVEGAKDSKVELDGQPIPAGLVGVSMSADPGAHRVTAQSPEGFKLEQTVVVKEGGSETVKLTFAESAPLPAAVPVGPQPAAEPTPTPVVATGNPPPGDRASSSDSSSTLRIASYAAFGVGVIGLGAGTYFILDSSSKSSDADKRFEKYGCPYCTAEQKQEVLDLDDDAASSKTLSAVGFVTGGVGLAAGITLLVLSMDHPKPQSAWVSPYVGASELGVIGQF